MSGPPIVEDFTCAAQSTNIDDSRVSAYNEEQYLEHFSDDADSSVLSGQKSLDLYSKTFEKITPSDLTTNPIGDPEGYLVQLDYGVKLPGYCQIPMKNRGIIGIARELVECPHEGWLSIWKGKVPSFISHLIYFF